jgi:hypothetical protein
MMEHEVLSIMVLLVMLGLLVLVGVLLFRTFRLLYEGERAPKASLLVGYLATAYGLLIFAFAGSTGSFFITIGSLFLFQ